MGNSLFQACPSFQHRNHLETSLSWPRLKSRSGFFGMHVTMGGFPMKAWMTQDGGKKVLAFSNGGRWDQAVSVYGFWHVTLKCSRYEGCCVSAPFLSQMHDCRSVQPSSRPTAFNVQSL